MPIIPLIGRKSWKMRTLIIIVYTVLICGSATTVYPFLIMLGSSVTSLADFQQYRVVPRYIYNDKALMVKYLDDKYRPEQFDYCKLRYHVEEPVEQVVADGKIYIRYGQYAEMEKLLGDYDIESDRFRRRVSDWLDFVKAVPDKYKDTFFHYRIYLSTVQVGFQEFLKAKYGSIEKMQEAFSDMTQAFVDVDPPYEAYDRHTWFPDTEPKTRDWQEYRSTLPVYCFNVVTLRGLYQKYLLDSYSTIEGLNAAWGTGYRYFWEIPFPQARPEGPSGQDWETYVRKKMPLRQARLDAAVAGPLYVDFITGKYRDVAKYNGLRGEHVSSFDEVLVPQYMPEESLALQDWQEFYEQKAPLEAIVIDSADARYASFLKEKYGDVSAVNAAYGTAFGSLADAEPPWREADYWDLKTRKSEIRRGFITRNYSFVIKRVFLQGRPIFNTFVLVSLTVLTAVTVNPLAAYALSRYRLKYSGNVLIFMLATMAFPAQVAMIPNFLMIKQLGLLNTFAALVLPGLASGYSIFLLKGFFDSLPQELYEAASIDGASEFRMFWMITMPLSLPILSVIALFAFSGAYGSFIWAFTVCQDSRMWTLMVFLQQFQAGMPSHPYVVLASLVIAAIPTIVVFLSAQKVLMKGIIVPTMK